MKKIYSTIGALTVFTLSISAQTTTFSYTGSMQTYVVPACVNMIHVDVQGAQGGGNPTGIAMGGNGGRVEADIPVTPGQTLYIYVGGAGVDVGTPGYNGGGAGIGGSPGTPGGGGGGASDIRFGGTTLNDRIIVAGGGGGGTENGGPATGGVGGGLIGGGPSPAANPWACTNLVEPTGGTQSAGGMGGTSTSCAWNGFNGSFGIGGDAYNNYRSAGGGGGWYGGGGAHNGCGGAGGSSYAYASASGVTHTQGYRQGNGQIIITDNIVGPVVIMGNDSLCAGDTSTYSISPVAGATSYVWSVPGGSTINSGQGTTAIGITSGSTSGNVSVYAVFPCGNSSTINLALNISMGPSVDANVTDTSICFGQSVIFTGSGAMSYVWSGGVIDSVPFTPTATNMYSVIGIDSFGCPDTGMVTVAVNTNPIVALGPDQTICGDTVCLDAGNPGAAYSWSTGDTTQVACVMSSGTYYVSVNDTNGCMGVDTVNVTINNLPVVSFMMPMIFACADDDSIAMSGTPSGGAFTGTGVFGTMFSPSAAGQGNHIITYTYTDSLGCTNSDTSAIYVDLCLGLNDAGNAIIKAYPNPNNGTFTLVAHQTLGATSLEIVDVQGRVVYSQNLAISAGGNYPIVLNGVANGIYTMKLTSDSGVTTQQITIQK